MLPFPRAGKIHPEWLATEFVRQLPVDATLWIFVLVRNPFDRAISAFFQILEDTLRKRRGAARDVTLELLHEMFASHVQTRSVSRSILATLPAVLASRNVTGGALSAPASSPRLNASVLPLYDRAAMDAWLIDGNTRVLVLRAEDSLSWPAIVKRRTNVTLADTALDTRTVANAASAKWYVKLYARFKTSYTFQTATVAETLQSLDMRSLYSEEERRTFAVKALSPAAFSS
jgi:hypothetical protein